MTLDVPEDAYRAIEQKIANPDSPVGIDATATHIMILYKLTQIEERLARIETTLAKASP